MHAQYNWQGRVYACGVTVIHVNYGKKVHRCLAGMVTVMHVSDDACNGGNMRVNSLRAEIVAWLNAFQKGWVGVGVN